MKKTGFSEEQMVKILREADKTPVSERCPNKAQCTDGEYRRIARWEHEAVLEAMEKRLERMPDVRFSRYRTLADSDARG